MEKLLAFLFLAVLGACSATGDATPTPAGTWAVVALDGADLGGLPRRPEITIAADGAMNGFGGVNNFSGRFEPEALAAGRLVAGPMAATRMAGPEPAMKAEARMFELLASALEWRRSGDKLTFSRGGSIVMQLRAAP